MNIVNNTSFRTAPVKGRLRFPGHSLTIVVKGTFKLTPGARASTAEEQLSTTGDEYHPDDEDHTGGLRYESDLAYFKPRADLLLVGKCHAPEGKPVPMCPVAFQVGDFKKTLFVFGNRRWEKHWLRWKATQPEPFTMLELRYESSFGGAKTAKNPVGKGDGPIGDSQGNEVRPLPNIEDPFHPVASPQDSPEPAGFGPLGRMWQTRHVKTGTYTGSYLESRWPWFPEDFDWSHFNAAPPDMQVEGYLMGDEKLCFENLHPEHPQYHSQLPGTRVRCFLNKQVDSEDEEACFQEVPMKLDTLWVDMESERLVLVWRGWVEVLSADCHEVQDLFIISEPLEQESASLGECRERFLLKLAEGEKEWAMEPEKPETQPGENSEAPAQAGKKPVVDPSYIYAQTNSILAQMGIDPVNLPPGIKEKQSKIIRKLAETDSKKIEEMERGELGDKMKEVLAEIGLDPEHLPPVSARAKAEQLRFMRELGVKPSDLAVSPELEKFWAILGAALPRIGLDPENLDPLIEQARKQKKGLNMQFGVEEETGTNRKELDPALTREQVQEKAARGESFAGMDLHGLDLSGLELKGLDFSGADMADSSLAGTNLQFAILTGANLSSTDLSNADLTGANLAETDLTKAGLNKAVLKDADFTSAILTQVDLTEALLTDAVFEKVRMDGSVLDRVEAEGTNFSEADLTECSFLKSSCPKADFSKAMLDRVNFRGANLCEALFEGAVARGIMMAETDLTRLRASEDCDFAEGIFWNAVGPESIWTNSNLAGSDFRGCRMEGAIFTGACLKRADISYADIRFGRFNEANLQQTRMIRMNFFQGSFEGADLTGADLSGSNMYGVEFLDAIVDNVHAKGTNLKMSKLRKMMERV